VNADVYSSFEPGVLGDVLAAWARELEGSMSFVLHPPAELRWGLTRAPADAGLRVLLLDPEGVRSALLPGETLQGLLDAMPPGRSLVFACPSRSGAALGVRGVVDLEALARDRGVRKIFDDQSIELAGIPYSEQLSLLLGTELSRRAHALLAPPLKVIAVDCDNTLWRGLCAEEGPLGVVVGKGERALQELLLRQKAAGRLIVLVSKNAQGDVEAVFRENPAMLLRRSDVVAMRVGWETKSSSLRALSAELSLGLDSFAFLDDSPVECAEVRSALPEVSVLPLGDDIERALAGAWFLDLVPSAPGGLREERTRLYQDEALRQQARAATPSYHDFVVSLGVSTRVSNVSEAELLRVYELSQRVNQFSTGAPRPTREEVAETARAGRVEKLEVRDRFGDAGLSGAVFSEPRGDRLFVTRLLLSCRVLGRGVEEDLFDHLLERARAAGAAELAIAFTATGRNEPAGHFLAHLGGSEEHEGLARVFVWPSRFVPKERFHQAPSRAAEEPPAKRGLLRAAPDWGRIAWLSTDRAALAAAFLPESDDAPLPHDRDAAILSIIGSVLGRPVSAGDNLYELGADSLRIVRILARLRARLSLSISIADVLHRAFVSDLLRLAAQSNAAADEPDFLDQVSALYDDGVVNS
jgi:FkbH-like protein